MAISMSHDNGVLSRFVTATFLWFLDNMMSTRRSRQSWLTWWNDSSGEKDSFQCAMAWLGLFLPISFVTIAAFAALHGLLGSNSIDVAPASWIPALLLGFAIGGFLVNYVRHLANSESTPTLLSDLAILLVASGLSLATFFQVFG